MLLQASDLTVRYGAITAVSGLTLQVAAGAAVALLGPNGAGKSSTVRALSGAVPVTDGTIVMDGQRLTGNSEPEFVRAGIVQVPEGRQIFPDFTVAENLAIGAFVRRDKHAVAADLERILGHFPRLRERISQRAGTLSGGEQQMLAIGRGLMAGPRLLLLDEPSLGLAPVIVDSLFEILGQINAGGMSMLVVEQNARVALRIASYAYIMDLGRVSYAGPAEDLNSDRAIWEKYFGT
jgi:branched-chain amino acid transport system ATP-binding protein